MLGELGWKPGFRNWDPDGRMGLLPPPTGNPSSLLKAFTCRLAELPASRALCALRGVRLRPSGDSSDLARDQCLEARLIRYLHERVATRQGVVSALYGRIAACRSEYELGAARPFLRLGLDYGDPAGASAGLALILARGLSPLEVNRECAHLRRFGKGRVLATWLRPVSSAATG